MSVDIVGSTAFKQAKSASDKAITFSGGIATTPNEFEDIWFSPFLQFYRQIDRIFSLKWKIHSENQQKLGGPIGAVPVLWKAVGDELIYFKDLNSSRDALDCIWCWKQSVAEHRKTLKDKYPSLDLKASAWIAGFPVNNSEVIIRYGAIDYDSEIDDGDPFLENAILLDQYHRDPKSSSLSLDFLGPSIDIGFRLASLSTPRKMVLSIDLALLISSVEVDLTEDNSFGALAYHYDGRVQLKGVSNGAPYPVVWVDMMEDDSLSRLEDILTPPTKRNAIDIRNFARKFIENNENSFHIPYIYSGTDSKFRVIPENHKLELAGLQEALRMANLRRQEEKASEAPSAGDEITQDENDAFLNTLEPKKPPE